MSLLISAATFSDAVSRHRNGFFPRRHGGFDFRPDAASGLHKTRREPREHSNQIVAAPKHTALPTPARPRRGHKKKAGGTKGNIPTTSGPTKPPPPPPPPPPRPLSIFWGPTIWL